MLNDAPQHSLKDSNASPKVKITKKEGVGVPSLARSTLKIKGHVRTLGWGLGRMTSESTIHTNQTNQTTSWLMRSWNTFGARTSHEHTRTHKIHHSMDLGEATTFPLIIFFVISHEGYIQMSFFPELPSLVPKFSKLGL